MNNFVVKEIEAIGKKVSDKLSELLEYEYEPGEQSPDGCVPDEVSMHVHFAYKTAEVECYVSWRGYKADVEFNIYNKADSLENLQAAVREWLKDNLDTDGLLDAVNEDIERLSEDEWTSHGFRDEADYLNYRYG